MSFHNFELPLLATVLLIGIIPTAFGQCAGGCASTDGDCVGTDCFCKPGKYGADCTTTCSPACTAPEVCTGAATCGACSPVCYTEGGTCTTLVAAPTCTCNADFSGNDCKTITCNGATDPCKNAGTCASGVCTCPATHAGLVCELACTSCTGTGQKCFEEGGSPVCHTTCADSDACLNGGTCTAELCSCAPGWEGDLCATVVPVCDPVCTAAQKCVAVDGSNVCQAKCDATTVCQNGGTCTADDLCECATGWDGDLCGNDAPTMAPSVLAVALLVLLRLL